MKKVIISIFFIAIIICIFVYRQSIITFIMQTIIYRQEVKITEEIVYPKKNDYFLLDTTNDFIIKNQLQILEVIYTILNNGWGNFSFFCDYQYQGCVEDVKAIFDDDVILSAINTAVHPYNSYRNIQLQIGTQNNFTFMTNKLYSDDKIEATNKKVDSIYNQVTNNQMTTKEKIKAIHDYIATHVTYDKNYRENIDDSNNAYGALVKGSAICSGYTDAMQLFLIKMGITNYKLTSEDHIWNYLYLDNKWYNLDVTWDDQSVNNREILIYDYFLITDSQLKAKKDNEHNYNNMFLIRKES